MKLIGIIGVLCVLYGCVDATQEVVTIGEDTQMGDAEIVYRVTWQTQMDSQHASASKGNFKIQIKGNLGDTGEQILVTHPGYTCRAEADAGCYPDIQGNRLADDDPSMGCNCDPSRDGYDEDAAKWATKDETPQSTNIKAADVGEITEVKITGDNKATDSWTPSFFKIDTNDRTGALGIAGGLGNGVYYMSAGKKINRTPSGTYEMKSDALDADGNPLKMENPASHGSGIIRCKADNCEEEMKMLKEATTKA